MKHGYFFDMDGVIYNSMPHHAQVWEETMQRHHLHFTAQDCYRNEGRTGFDVIHEVILRDEHREASHEEIARIYAEKTNAFLAMGHPAPIPDIQDVLHYLKNQGHVIWIVTGSGQDSLFETLNKDFPNIFARERMITAYDVTHGKPNPEPYLKAWERSGLQKEDCCVIENAPLGIRAAKAAGLFTIGVNTGVLTRDDLQQAGADVVLDNMKQLLEAIRQSRF